MKTTTVEPFYIIGLAIRTTNENGKAATDIPQLWGKFFSENSPAKILNKMDNTVYCVYTNYEKDHTKPYTTILGYRVAGLDAIPEGFVGKTIGGRNYSEYTVKGKLSDNIVYNEWLKIWNEPIARTYTSDFEVYGEKAQNPDDAEVAIYIAVK